MPTKRTTKKESPASGAGAAPSLKRKRAPKAAAAAPAGAVPQVLAAPSEEFTASEREAIERLAYSYWRERGCHGGSAEEDWLRAEAEIVRRRAQAGETSG